MLAEEWSRGQALEELALLNGPGNTFRSHCTGGNSLGEAVGANVGRRPFEMVAVWLVEHFRWVDPSPVLEGLSERHMHHFLNGYYHCKYYNNLNKTKSIR